MNFSSAFKYPFRNFAKVMSIVLVLTIALSVCIALILNTYDWTPLLELFFHIEQPDAATDTLAPMSGATATGAIGLFLVVVFSGFWLTGYSIEVIRSVMRYQDWMPEIDFGRNVKDGFFLFVSSMVYALLFILLMVVIYAAYHMLGSIAILGVLGGFALIFAPLLALLLMGWGYFIGMARFAAESNRGALWQIGRNIRLARDNWRAGIKLNLKMIAMSIIYIVVFSIVDSIVEGIVGGFISSDLMAVLTVWIISYYVFNLTQHFSTQHLIAQYAVAIGLRSDNYKPEKDKVDAF